MESETLEIKEKRRPERRKASLYRDQKQAVHSNRKGKGLVRRLVERIAGGQENA